MFYPTRIRSSFLQRFLFWSYLFLAGSTIAFAADGEGTAKLSPSRSRVNSVGTWTVTYTVGTSGLKEGGGIKVQFPVSWFSHAFSNIKAVQHDNPDKNHYVTVQASRQDVKIKLTIDDVMLDGQRDRPSRLFVVRLEQGELKAGDRI
ncbi:MAG: hypothetical protein L0387_28825, partial [Acidobacteria bacterium]|nr:hypothetical protein [Acidobacteriota bacterium]